jgi:hypothetical protein
MKKFLNRLTVTVFFIGLVAGLLLGSFLLTWLNYNEEIATVLQTCADESYRPACYDRELPKYMDQGYSMEAVFEITKAVQEKDTTYQYCHVLGHYLSQKETAKDPSKWKEVIARAPRGICSNGAIHGAFQERFRAESLPDASVAELKAELSGVCEPRVGWDGTPLEQASCLHALGHLTMYATDGNIDKSLTLCAELVPPDGDRNMNLQLCYDGAFMQIFQPLEPEDIALVDHYDVDTPEKAATFCRQYTDEQFGSCVSESWPLSKEMVQNPTQIASRCEPVAGTGWQHERCLNGMFYVAVAIMNLESEQVMDFCTKVPTDFTGRCFGNAVTRMIEVDWDNTKKATELCAAVGPDGARQACFDELLKHSTYSFKVGSPEFVLLCENMPSPQKEECFGRM